jgi:PPM family protein phosphatase
MKLGRTYALSDPGRRRRRNEDSYVVSPPLFAVADGMGGAQAGELASRIAVDAMGSEGGTHGEERVRSLIEEANRRVFARSSEDAAASGMGTTMTAALVGDGEVTIGHVGDSRAYLLRGGRLQQLTDDHSLVAELMRSGRLSAEEAETHPQRSVITRALGTDPEVTVDAFTVPAEAGDLFLICSDGLTTMLDDDEILGTIEDAREDLEEAARRLIGKANRGGGEDNITVVFFEIAEDEAFVADDEDTLTELDAVPTLDDTAIGPAEAPPQVRDELDETAKRVLVIMAIVAAAAVGVALLVLAFHG